MWSKSFWQKRRQTWDRQTTKKREKRLHVAVWCMKRREQKMTMRLGVLVKYSNNCVYKGAHWPWLMRTTYNYSTITKMTTTLAFTYSLNTIIYYYFWHRWRRLEKRALASEHTYFFSLTYIYQITFKTLVLVCVRSIQSSVSVSSWTLSYLSLLTPTLSSRSVS